MTDRSGLMQRGASLIPVCERLALVLPDADVVATAFSRHGGWLIFDVSPGQDAAR